MEADWGRSVNPERKVNASKMDGYALCNRKHREQRGLEFRANLSVYQNHLEDLLTHRVLSPAPQWLVQEVWGGALETAFLTASRWCQCCWFRNYTSGSTD